MKYYRTFLLLSFFILCLFLQQCRQAKKPDFATAGEPSYYQVNDYASIEKYDTHVHLNVYDSTFIELAKADNFRLLSVNVNPAYYPPIEEQQNIAVRLVKAFPRRLAYATTFSLENWGTNGWQQKTLTYLKESFEKGAIAVKVWKNIGMELRDKNDKFVMIDDPGFDPIFDYLEQQHIPVLGHLGEPQDAWLPVEKMNIKSNQNYFSKHPEFHMFLHPEFPTYQDQIAARDHMLEKHPDLKFIGAHLGSLEWSTEELGKRLDRFPNMAVDMAARLSHLQYQAATDWKKVHDFFIKYQDRLIYATDLEAGGTINKEELKKNIHDKWMHDWNFFVSDSIMHSPAFDAEFKGLKLPKAIMNKIYQKNAENWFPGINK